MSRSKCWHHNSSAPHRTTLVMSRPAPTQERVTHYEASVSAMKPDDRLRLNDEAIRRFQRGLDDPQVAPWLCHLLVTTRDANRRVRGILDMLAEADPLHTRGLVAIGHGQLPPEWTTGKQRAVHPSAHLLRVRTLVHVLGVTVEEIAASVAAADLCEAYSESTYTHPASDAFKAALAPSKRMKKRAKEQARNEKTACAASTATAASTAQVASDQERIPFESARRRAYTRDAPKITTLERLRQKREANMQVRIQSRFDALMARQASNTTSLSLE